MVLVGCLRLRSFCFVFLAFGLFVSYNFVCGLFLIIVCSVTLVIGFMGWFDYVLICWFDYVCLGVWRFAWLFLLLVAIGGFGVCFCCWILWFTFACGFVERCFSCFGLYVMMCAWVLVGFYGREFVVLLLICVLKGCFDLVIWLYLDWCGWCLFVFCIRLFA